jgi:polyisoprenoid-binding protein YceI
MRSLATLVFASVAAIGVAAPVSAADYKIDPSHTHVLFLVNHLGFSNMIGLFSDTAGTVAFDPANVGASKLNIAVKTASLQTQCGPRDLKGADWFNVAEFPEMSFSARLMPRRATSPASSPAT